MPHVFIPGFVLIVTDDVCILWIGGIMKGMDVVHLETLYNLCLKGANKTHILVM